MLNKIETLEQARSRKWNTGLEGASKPNRGGNAINLGQIEFHRESDKHEEVLAIWRHIFNEMPPIRLVPWKYIREFINEGKLQTHGQLHHNALCYQRYLSDGWTEKLRPDHPLGGGAMDFMNNRFEYQKLSTVSDHEDCNELNDEEEGSLCSVYYHAAKAHWLLNSVQKEGLRHCVQGHTHTGGPKEYNLSIHPGSVRIKVLETLDNPDFLTLVTDYADIFTEVKPLSFDELIDYWRDLSGGEGNLSAIYVQEGKFEWSLAKVAGLDFRHEVFDFNRKVTTLCKKKPVNIYLGYDSSHEGIYEAAEKSIHHAIQKSKSGGVASEYFNDYKVEVKKLDINAISEYTRPYANQSTEFTYSRFLIPYLENYEGFSFFIDDDYLWKLNPMSLFYFLDPEHAVACVQYDFKHHDETKMDGEKNVSYPKKLWSSMMIFNNNHEDCKKLTPEVVNTASGQYLHQFEWTDQISEIPGHKICTEGYDEKFEETHHAIHYTRGGPWIKGMDYSHINNLETWQKFKER